MIIAYLREDISDEDSRVLQEWLNREERHRKLLDELRDKVILQRDVNSFNSFDSEKSWKCLERKMSGVSTKRTKNYIPLVCGSGVCIWCAGKSAVLAEQGEAGK